MLLNAYLTCSRTIYRLAYALLYIDASVLDCKAEVFTHQGKLIICRGSGFDCKLKV